IIDIYDATEMSDTNLNPTNPVWVQITICLAVVTFYTPSFLEIYYLRFPELTNGSTLSEQRVRLSQFLSSCMFLALRVVLLAYNPHEIGFAIKTSIRLYYHYKTWSNLHRAPNIVSIQETEIANAYRYNEIPVVVINITADIDTSINYNRYRSLSV
ncbi:Hypothetical predicted protein, partial [Paramuricea clavata]